jgi:hypothetical protein
MTSNEKAAHAVAYDKTRRLRWTKDKMQKIHAAASDDYNEAYAEFADAYEAAFQEALTEAKE